jgi:hypothetical protein
LEHLWAPSQRLGDMTQLSGGGEDF